MLERFFVAAALIATPAIAQQPPSDSITATYVQLLSEANMRVANMAGQLAQAQAKSADLQKQIDALKPKEPPAPALQ